MKPVPPFVLGLVTPDQIEQPKRTEAPTDEELFRDLEQIVEQLVQLRALVVLLRRESLQ